jgi:hypothetical protein
MWMMKSTACDAVERIPKKVTDFFEKNSIRLCDPGAISNRSPDSTRAEGALARTPKKPVGVCGICLATVLLASPGSAQQPAPAGKEIMIGGEAPARGAPQRCVDVEIGGERTPFGCLNQWLRRQVDQTNPNRISAPLDASSQDIKTGLVNTSAVRQQYGRNYGISAVPYRPPPVVYNAPLGPPR